LLKPPPLTEQTKEIFKTAIKGGFTPSKFKPFEKQSGRLYVLRDSDFMPGFDDSSKLSMMWKPVR
jgi:hypothetical protein